MTPRFAFLRPARPKTEANSSVSPILLVGEARREEYVDLERLCDAIGVAVERHPYRPEITGTAQRRGDGWVIGVNRSDTVNRQRMTIAHEIGHILLHADLLMKRTPLQGVSDNHDYRQPDIESHHNDAIMEIHERQATIFAIRLLMAEDKIRTLMAEGLDAGQIGMVIGCSAAAVAIRMRGLTERERSAG